MESLVLLFLLLAAAPGAAVASPFLAVAAYRANRTAPSPVRVRRAWLAGLMPFAVLGYLAVALPFLAFSGGSSAVSIQGPYRLEYYAEPDRWDLTAGGSMMVSDVVVLAHPGRFLCGEDEKGAFVLNMDTAALSRGEEGESFQALCDRVGVLGRLDFLRPEALAERKGYKPLLGALVRVAVCLLVAGVLAYAYRRAYRAGAPGDDPARTTQGLPRT